MIVEILIYCFVTMSVYMNFTLYLSNHEASRIIEGMEKEIEAKDALIEFRQKEISFLYSKVKELDSIIVRYDDDPAIRPETVLFE